MFSVTSYHEETRSLLILLIAQRQSGLDSVSCLQILKTKVSNSDELIFAIGSFLAVIIIDTEPSERYCQLNSLNRNIISYMSLSSLSKYPFSDSSLSVIMKSFHSGFKVF